jgi:glucose/mannose transport system substrate-binding protein
MKKYCFNIFALFVVLSMALVACAPAATPAPVEPTKAPEATKAPEPTAAPAEPTAAPTVAAAEPTAAPTAAAAEPTKAAEAPAAAAATGKVEIFSWWTAGGEAEGLKAMLDVFSAANPGVEIVNATVAGGAGTNAKAVLATRLQGGNPPDSFQVHAGLEVEKYSPADYLLPVDDLLDPAVYPADLLSMLKYEDHYWSIPVNIHRSNVLWYSKAAFEKAGIKAAPESMDEFFADCELLKAKGITPVTMGTKEGWEAAHVFEGFLASELGPDAYIGLWKGTTPWTDAKVTKALEDFKKMMTYVNTDNAAMTWDQAADNLIAGKAGMEIMGDWAAGGFASKKFADYGWAATPGSKGTFVGLSDSFALPKGAANEAGAKAWLTVAGSKAGQEAFNPMKGSICARTDCDAAAFKAVPETYDYLMSASADWKSNRIVPSIVHGAATIESWATAYKDTMQMFVADGDVAKAQTALGKLCTDAGVCK